MTLPEDTWKSADEILRTFDENKDDALDFHEFKTLCGQLFEPHEIQDAEYRLRDIFDIFDCNADGQLNGDEWTRCYDDWLSVVVSPVCALLVIDVQNDFIDGTLALKNCGAGEDGAEVVEPINSLVKEKCWKKIVYSLDWHPETHIGFYENLHMRPLHPDSKIQKEDAKAFDTVRFLEPDLEQRLWPRHCVIDSWGAELHKDLEIAPDSDQVNALSEQLPSSREALQRLQINYTPAFPRKFTGNATPLALLAHDLSCTSGQSVRKGQNPDMDAYSAFFDNEAEHATELVSILKDNGITDIFVCGLALDVCVKATCLDGLRLGYRLAVIEDLCRGVDLRDIDETRKSIIANGGLVTNGNEALALASGQKRSLTMAHHAASVLATKSIGEELANAS